MVAAVFCLTTVNQVNAQDIVKVVADTHIQVGNPDGNFSTTNQFIVKTNADEAIDRMGLLKFDFNSLSDYDASNVLSAQLFMGYHNSHNGTISIYEYASSWEESTVTWNNAPATVATIAELADWTAIGVQTTSADWHRDVESFHGGLDITSYFKTCMEDDKIMSLALVGEASGSGYDIHQKENTTISIDGHENWGAYILISYVSQAANALSESFDGNDLPAGYSVSNSGTYTVSNSLIDVDMVLSGDKYRADIWYNEGTSTAGSDISMNSAIDKYLAIKFQGERPDGNLKFEMKTASDVWMNTQWNYGADGQIVSTGSNNIYYFDLTKDESYSGAIDIRRLHFIIADNVNSQSYQIDWIGTFPSVDAIETIKDQNDISTPTDIKLSSFSKLNVFGASGSIEISNCAVGNMISVYSMSGTLVYEGVAKTSNVSVKCSNGLYLVAVKGVAIETTKVFVK
ncbi:CBM96 family carbohydrate-binding protein [Geofilum sp. OHC36d9]|uniref:CBM96 family carbohydrate-binding protein n=1 Tax=Geofilum sp. OHC36d9 TaxID=3458413 RepID=UPI0040344942